jgi:hypothetical protein
MASSTDNQQTAARIIIAARKDLGTDLGGWSLVDLLADNMPLSIDEIREVLIDIEEH